MRTNPYIVVGHPILTVFFGLLILGMLPIIGLIFLIKLIIEFARK